MKKALIIILAILILGAAAGGFLIYRHASITIGRKAAVEIALADAGLERSQIYDVDVDYEHGWYDVEFESPRGDLFYRIDARTGAILTGGYDD